MSQSPPRSQTEFNPERFDLLLQAAFLTGSRALTAFEQWNRYNDWDDAFNLDEYRLFPQLYRNLTALDVDHPLMAKFRGIARKSWYNNNLFFPRFAATLKRLHEANIPGIILGGGAFALRYYNDHVLSPAPGTGILVHPHQARAAYEQLHRAGWQPQWNLAQGVPDSFFTARYFNYWQNQNNDHLFLQWQLLPGCPAEDTDALFWQRAQEIETNRVPALVLDPTDQLLVTCAFGSLPLGATREQRSVGVMLLLNAARDQLNWNQFLECIAANHFVLPAREILLPLAAKFPTHIPARAVEKMNALPISSDEQKNRILWDAVTPNKRTQQLWRIHELRSCNASAPTLAASFPTFLQHWWGLQSLGQVPRHALTALRRQRSLRK